MGVQLIYTQTQHRCALLSISAQGMRRPEVVKLLRDTEGKVTLVVSRQEAVEEQEQDTAHVSSGKIVVHISI